jgi:hypothetical protein
VTKPVQEPTVQRALANDQWAIAQLQRRPAPPGHQYPALRALAGPPGGSAITVPNNTETPVLFDVWENEDSSIFQEGIVGAQLQKVRFLAQGVYTIAASAAWDNNFDAYKGVLILDDSGTSGEWDLNTTPNMGMYASRFDSFQFTYPLTFSVTRKYPLLGVQPGDLQPAGVYGICFVKLVQLSGISQDAEGVWLDIFYLGPTMTSI